MKKVLVGVLFILLVIGGGAYYLYSHLDTLVEQAIETAGSAATGTAVRVDSVSLDLAGGRATIRGFTVANPPGYSADNMLSFAELSVALDLRNLSRENIGIQTITARDPRVLYESRDGTSNVDTVAERLSAGAPAEAKPQQDRAQPNIAIGNLVIENIQAGLRSELLPKPVDVELGDITLENLSGTPAELARQVLRPILRQVAAGAGKALLSARAEDLKDTAANAVEAAAARLEEAQRKASERLDEAAGNLLRRD